jgi:molybdopterin synthase catalytic subunit
MFGALAEVARRDDTFDVGDDATVSMILEAVRERYPASSVIIDRSCVAVNQDVVDPTHAIDAADEVAILPPMSGGVVWVRLSERPSVAGALAAVSDGGAGGTVTFSGTVRGSCELGAVDRLEYTAYDPMATKVMGEIAQEASVKFTVRGVAIDHAVGVRLPGEITFVVACAAERREEAFEGCRYVVDEVKRRAPIWKKEIGPWGARWPNL